MSRNKGGGVKRDENQKAISMAEKGQWIQETRERRLRIDN